LVENNYFLVAGAAALLLILWVTWIIQHGLARGTAATISRALWISPIFIAFFPQTRTVPLPKSLALKTIRVMIDDSASMQRKSGDLGGGNLSDKSQKILKAFEEECGRLSCAPKVSFLSAYDQDVERGYSPIDRVLKSWIFKAGSDPWMLISDGGDMQPAKPWSQSLDGLGQALPGQKTPRGFIVGFPGDTTENVWIESVDAAPFSFEGKPISAAVILGRTGDVTRGERVQIQAKIQDDAVVTVNAEFEPGQKDTSVQIVLPPLRRNQYLVSVHVLPTASEKILWDNEAYFNVEVMPNTVGILHLLGSPTWDGRFLRRYLKSEPKYDLISFFILRDPWDSQQVNERELSLIPFPVERLFNEELPNFRVIVLQNFTLLQFLLPEYQENLVKFVKDGGGLLFIGGERALQDVDLRNSPLKEILPFATSGGDASASSLANMMPLYSGSQPARVDHSGPWYDPDLKFQIELAQPEIEKRNLANVYDDWEALSKSLETFKWMKGIHHMENVKFRPNEFTPLLNAKTEDGKTIPFAIASYPGKGRALWFFSDSLWRLAQTGNKDIPRETYGLFMQASITWLLRQDLKKPLIISGLEFDSRREGKPAWRAKIEGPAARYYQTSDTWQLIVCGKIMDHREIQAEKIGSDSWILSGVVPVDVTTLNRCEIEIHGKNMAFGSVKATSSSPIPKFFLDKEIGDSSNKLRSLAELTGAQINDPTKNPDGQLRAWLENLMGTDGVVVPNKFHTAREFYWILDTWYFWLLLSFLPLEILIRRWDKLVSSGGRAYKRAWQKRQELS
jgi:hypothetical protein